MFGLRISPRATYGQKTEPEIEETRARPRIGSLSENSVSLSYDGADEAFLWA